MNINDKIKIQKLKFEITKLKSWLAIKNTCFTELMFLLNAFESRYVIGELSECEEAAYNRAEDFISNIFEEAGIKKYNIESILNKRLIFLANKHKCNIEDIDYNVLSIKYDHNRVEWVEFCFTLPSGLKIKYKDKKNIL